jgi:hypothetical protein
MSSIKGIAILGLRYSKIVLTTRTNYIIELVASYSILVIYKSPRGVWNTVMSLFLRASPS